MEVSASDVLRNAQRGGSLHSDTAIASDLQKGIKSRSPPVGGESSLDAYISTTFPVSALSMAPKTIERLLMLSVQMVSGVAPDFTQSRNSRMTPP